MRQEKRGVERLVRLNLLFSDCALRGTSMQKEHAKSCGFCLAAEKQIPLMGAPGRSSLSPVGQ